MKKKKSIYEKPKLKGASLLSVGGVGTCCVTVACTGLVKNNKGKATSNAASS